MSQEPDEDDKCRLVTEVALKRAVDACGSEEQVRNQVQRLVGLDSGVDPDCDASLENGLDMATLANTRATRQWVFCRAWQLVDEEDKAMGEAVERAWREAESAGEENEIEV